MVRVNTDCSQGKGRTALTRPNLFGRNAEPSGLQRSRGENRLTITGREIEETTVASGEIQIDNGIFRVTKWMIEPGGEIPMHVHEYDYVVVPLVDDTMFVTNADGSELRAELRIGQSYTRPAGIEHSVMNRGTASIAFIETEKLS